MCQSIVPHWTGEQIVNLAGVLAQLNGGLLAIVVTVVAIVPALVEMAISRSTDFLAERASKRRLSKTLAALRWSVPLFAVAILLSLVCFIIPDESVLLIVIGLSALGILVIAVTGWIAATTLSSTFVVHRRREE